MGHYTDETYYNVWIFNFHFMRSKIISKFQISFILKTQYFTINISIQKLIDVLYNYSHGDITLHSDHVNLICFNFNYFTQKVTKFNSKDCINI